MYVQYVFAKLRCAGSEYQLRMSVDGVEAQLRKKLLASVFWIEMKCAHLTRATHTGADETSPTDHGTGDVREEKMVANAVPKGQTLGLLLIIFCKEWFWVFFWFSVNQSPYSKLVNWLDRD